MLRLPLLLSFLVLGLLSTRSAAQTTARDEIMTGIAFHGDGRYEEALAAYSRALKLSPNDPDANYEMAHTYMAMKRYPEVIEHANKVIASKSSTGNQAYELKGTAFDMLGNSKEAVKTYRTGIKKYPEYHLLRFNLAVTHVRRDELELAEEQLKNSVRLRPTHPGSHYVLGLIALRKQERPQAILAFMNLLLLEQNGQRAQQAHEQLISLIDMGVERKSATEININLLMPTGKRDDGMRVGDVGLSMIRASRLGAADSLGYVHPVDAYLEDIDKFIAILDEQRIASPKKYKGFWWDYYVRFYSEMRADGHLPALVLLSLTPSTDPEARDRIKADTSMLDNLYNWCNEQPRSFR